jgi:hypothetical protein
LQPVIAIIYEAAQQGDNAMRSALLLEIGDRIAKHPVDRIGMLGVLCGALIEQGAPPKDFPGAVYDRLREQLDTITAPDDERELPDGYYRLEQGAMAALSRSAELRRKLPQKAALLGAIKRYSERYGFLGKMLNVLDDEELVVLHPESKRGWTVTIGGIADNFQLHAMLHEAFSPHIEGALGHWQLAQWFALREGTKIDTKDYNRTWIWNEGFPAEIAKFEDRRTLLLGKSTIKRSWNAGRVFAGMDASMTPPLPLADAASVLTRIAEAAH